MTDRPGTIGSALGDDARRARNATDVNAQLYEMHDAGALVRFEHRQEPARHNPEQQVDVWDCTFAGESRVWSYPYSQVRALIRGWRLGQKHQRS